MQYIRTTDLGYKLDDTDARVLYIQSAETNMASENIPRRQAVYNVRHQHITYILEYFSTHDLHLDAVVWCQTLLGAARVIWGREFDPGVGTSTFRSC